MDRTREPTLFDEPAATTGAQPTLEALVTGAWEVLCDRRTVACPLCGGEMTPVDSAHARIAGGRCGECGTTLS